MTTLVLISIVLAILGVGWFTKRKGELPVSVSSIVYDLPKKVQFLWTLWIWLTIGLIVPPMIEALPDIWQFVGFLFALCGLFCGAMPLTDEDTEAWHGWLGIGAGVLSQVCVALACAWWLLVWMVLVVLIGLGAWSDKPWVQTLYLKLEGHGVLLLEGLCAASVYGMLLTK